MVEIAKNVFHLLNGFGVRITGSNYDYGLRFHRFLMNQVINLLESFGKNQTKRKISIYGRENSQKKEI